MRVRRMVTRGFGTLNVAVATALVAMPAVIAAGFLGERIAPAAMAPLALRGTFDADGGPAGPDRPPAAP